MSNTDTFRRIRHTFDLNDSALIDIFSQADVDVTAEQLAAWLPKDPPDDDAAGISDSDLASFLNGFINLKRGKRDGAQPKPANTLNNNMVLQKLRIALNLQAEDTLEILQLADIRLSKHELSALFRKADNKHYRECSDDILHGFLAGVYTRLHDTDGVDSEG